MKKPKIQKPKSLPMRFHQGCLKQLDRRTELYGSLSQSFDAIVEDLGDAEQVSRIEQCLIERFVFCDYLVRKLEIDVANGNDQLQTYWRLCNTLNSIAAKLGINRRPRSESGLKDYLKGKA